MQGTYRTSFYTTRVQKKPLLFFGIPRGILPVDDAQGWQQYLRLQGWTRGIDHSSVLQLTQGYPGIILVSALESTILSPTCHVHVSRPHQWVKSKAVLPYCFPVRSAPLERSSAGERREHINKLEIKPCNEITSS